MIHGVNPQTPILMAILDLDGDKGVKFPEKWSPYEDGLNDEGEAFVNECIEKKQYMTGRFRDIYLNEDGTLITLYTRNGGGNRNEYFYIFDILKTHPNYLNDYDDDFDGTYAYVEFSIPEQAKDLIKTLVTGEKPLTVSEKFEQTMKEMQGMSKEDFEKDPRFKPIKEMFEKIAEFEKS
jgi:hypothetical protein